MTQGVGRGSRVGVLLTPSARMVAALLGIFKAGAAYVPLDTGDPPLRQKFILSDSGAISLLTDRSLAAALPTDGRWRLCMIEDCLESETAPAAVISQGNEVACVMYAQSGPDGPSGALLTHHAIASAVDAARQSFSVERPLRTLAIAPVSEAGSLLEVFGPLSSGGCLFVPSPADISDGQRLAMRLEAWPPNLLQISSSRWRSLCDAGWRGTDEIVGLVGDDEVDSDTAQDLIARCTSAFLVSCQVEACGVMVASDLTWRRGQMSVGAPLTGMRGYVLTPGRQLADVGVAGELWVSGPALATGYHGRESTTTERFAADPWVDRADARMFQTGVLARRRGDNEFEILGRVDGLAMIRGRLTHPAAAERALERHPSVRTVAVEARIGPSGERQLVAHVVATPPTAAGDLRRFLRDSLPEYAIPVHFQLVEQLPVTREGEIDRRRLPSVGIPSDRSFVPPRTPLERKLVGLWEELLDTRPVSITDNFFELGGHSMLAARLCARIGEETGRKLHIATLFQAPTIERLAARIEDGNSPVEPLIVPLRTDASGRPYFCVPGAGDNPFIFADLAAHIAADRPVYSFRLPDDVGNAGASPAMMLQRAAEALVREMRAVQPTGPYLLGGYCLGGLVAFEMARQLHDAGEPVASLTIFETYLPGGVRQSRWRDRLIHQWRHVRGLDWRGRVEFIHRMSGRRLVRMARRRSAWLGEAVAPLATAADYMPRHVFAGRLILFRARTSESGVLVEREMGWRGFAQAITVNEISGHHTNAYKEPHLSTWIGVLRGALTHADAGPACSD